MVIRLCMVKRSQTCRAGWSYMNAFCRLGKFCWNPPLSMFRAFYFNDPLLTILTLYRLHTSRSVTYTHTQTHRLPDSRERPCRHRQRLGSVKTNLQVRKWNKLFEFVTVSLHNITVRGTQRFTWVGYNLELSVTARSERWSSLTYQAHVPQSPLSEYKVN